MASGDANKKTSHQCLSTAHAMSNWEASIRRTNSLDPEGHEATMIREGLEAVTRDTQYTVPTAFCLSAQATGADIDDISVRSLGAENVARVNQHPIRSATWSASGVATSKTADASLQLRQQWGQGHA